GEGEESGGGNGREVVGEDEAQGEGGEGEQGAARRGGGWGWGEVAGDHEGQVTRQWEPAEGDAGSGGPCAWGRRLRRCGSVGRCHPGLRRPQTRRRVGLASAVSSNGS